MPAKASTPCRAPGCGRATHLGFCEQHRGQRSNWKHGQSVTQRGYGHAWRKLRVQVLQRDGYLCQAHLRRGQDVPGNEVDHVVPKARGGTDNMDNLETLCGPCHGAKTAREGGVNRQRVMPT